MDAGITFRRGLPIDSELIHDLVDDESMHIVGVLTLKLYSNE